MYDAVAEPRYPRQTAVEECQEQQRIKRLEAISGAANQLHPYEEIQARELYECFDTAKMILICQKNSLTAYEYFKFKVDCHKKNAKCKVYNRQVIRKSIKDTRFAAMIPILTATQYSCMLFSDEWNVGEMLKIFKKTPKVLLLAGSLGDRFMSRAELEHFAQLPDITTVRAQFVATLNSVGGQLTNHLQSHQSNLCYMLDAHADVLKSAGSAVPKSENPK